MGVQDRQYVVRLNVRFQIVQLFGRALPLLVLCKELQESLLVQFLDAQITPSLSVSPVWAPAGREPAEVRAVATDRPDREDIPGLVKIIFDRRILVVESCEEDLAPVGGSADGPAENVRLAAQYAGIPAVEIENTQLEAGRVPRRADQVVRRSL